MNVNQKDTGAESGQRGECLISLARACRNALTPFRNERRRNKNFTFGRQFEEVIEVEGKLMTEQEYIRSEGGVPLKNNLIRKIVRNVGGLFRDDLEQQMQEWEPEVKERGRLNRVETLFTRTFEEFLISGMAVVRKWRGMRDGVYGVWTDPVSPESFFFDPLARDPRGMDMEIVGQVHELPVERFCIAFARDPVELRRLEALAGDERRMTVYEIWQRTGKLVKSGDRWIPDHVWRYAYVTHTGVILREGDSPYPGGRHPFVVAAYPFLDGEIHSFVGDLIDQQRYTNRLITLYDWVVRASAKGVLLYPEEAVSSKYDFLKVRNEWCKFNGVIVYNSHKGTVKPTQVTGNNMNIGIGELLDIQLKMMEDVSGVNGVLQGRQTSGSVSGSLYNRQTENALVSLRDIIGTFRSFITDSLELDSLLARSS